MSENEKRIPAKEEWHPKRPEFAADSVAADPKYQLTIEPDHPIFDRQPTAEGVLRPELQQAIEEMTGVHVELNAEGLPTRESLLVLAQQGMNGEVLASRLVAQFMHEAKGEGRKKAEELQATIDGVLKELSDQRNTRIAAERVEVYGKLWPFDRPENPTGQRVAAWMRNRAMSLNIVVDGKLAKQTWRSGASGMDRYGRRELGELAEMMGTATEAEFNEICPSVSREEAMAIINDPHLARLLEVVQPTMADRSPGGADVRPEVLAEFLRLEHYVDSLPYSVGGLREILQAHARAFHGRMSVQSEYHEDLREAFERTVGQESTFPTYASYRAEQQKPTTTRGGLLGKVLGWLQKN